MFFRSQKERIKNDYADAIQSFTELGAAIHYNKRRDIFYIMYQGQRYEKIGKELLAFDKKIKDERSGDLENLNI